MIKTFRYVAGMRNVSMTYDSSGECTARYFNEEGRLIFEEKTQDPEYERERREGRQRRMAEAWRRHLAYVQCRCACAGCRCACHEYDDY